jgi:hypothetical protein
MKTSLVGGASAAAAIRSDAMGGGKEGYTPRECGVCRLVSVTPRGLSYLLHVCGLQTAAAFAARLRPAPRRGTAPKAGATRMQDKVAVREAVRVVAASKAHAAAAAAATAAAAAEAAAAAAAEVDALEREMAGGGEGGGEGGSSGVAGPSEASEEAVPDQFMCSITAEIMTDPVSTVRLGPCPRWCPATPSFLVATGPYGLCPTLAPPRRKCNR